MKYYYSYIVALLSIVALCTACEKQEPDVFSAANNGVYFNYETTGELSANCNFADYVVENPETLEIPVKVRLLGHLSDKARGVMLKGRAMEGYQEATLEGLPLLITFESGEYEKTVVINAKRPEVDDTQYATELYLEPQDETIGTGIEGFETFSVYVTASYVKPDSWDYSGAADYFGEWTKEKHLFLAREVFGTADYTDEYSMGDFYNVHSQWVPMLRELGDETTIEIPLYYNSNYSGWYSYPKPPYWTALHNKYITDYDKSVWDATTTFLQIAHRQGLTTKTEEAYFTGDEDRMKEINKSAVSMMQEIYDNLYLQGMTPGSYSSRFEVPLFADIAYDLRQPLCWSASQSVSNAMLEQYYGPYSLEKLQFMVKTVVEQQPDRAAFYWMFPVSRYFDYDAQSYIVEWGMLNTPDYSQFFSGEEVVAAMNALFRSADTENRFNFPVISAPGGGKDDGKGDDKNDDKK